MYEGLVRVCVWVGICRVQTAANLVVCVCFARSVTLILLTTAVFTPQSKAELHDAVNQC